MNINYQEELDNLISGLDYKPKLLLHSCCGPCSSYVLEYLNDYFDITVFFYNPNIYPEGEYNKRLSDQKKLLKEMFIKPLKLIELPYNHDEYLSLVNGLENEKEGCKRCFVCYKLRLQKTAEYAKENKFDYFATTLTVSPYKNANKLNEIGKELEEELNIKYLVSDFKKRNGYKRSIELSNKYDLYRQNYCGCEFSMPKEYKSS